jgi:plasmid replication initiation protein
MTNLELNTFHKKMSKRDFFAIKRLFLTEIYCFINAKYSYTLWEKRVFLYMISQLRRDGKEFPIMRIPIKELMTFYGAMGKSEYQIIRNVPENIIKKPFYIPYVASNGEKRWMFFSVISAGTQPDASEQREESYIELQFNPVLIPHLLELKEKFTKYNIRNISELQSVYSIRIFEYIKENEFKKDGFEASIDELKEMLFMKAGDNNGVELYPLYADFKKRVLLKAQEDLTKYCDTTYEFDEIKEGRRVVSIYFRPIKNKDNNNMTTPSVSATSKSVENLDSNILADLVLMAQSMGIGAEILQLLIDSQQKEDIQNGLSYTLREFNQGKIKDNVAGFFINAVKNKYTSAAFEKEQKQAQTAADKKRNEKKRKDLNKQLELLSEEYFFKLNDIIREITNQDDSITQKAIDVVKKENSLFFKSKKMNPNVLALEDFRKDKALRELVIQQIQIQNPQFFDALGNNYIGAIKALEREIRELK